MQRGASEKWWAGGWVLATPLASLRRAAPACPPRTARATLRAGRGMAPAARRAAVVVGSGFVGLSSALALQRTGRFASVTLLERAAGGAGSRASASAGNAGTFAAYANIPVARPGLWKDALPMLLDNTKPLSLAATPHLLRMLPWAARFLRACRPDAVRHSALALGALLREAQAAYDAIFEQAGVDVDAPMGSAYAPNPESVELPFAARNGYMILQRTPEAMEGSKASAALRREGLGPSLRMEALDTAGVQDLEPGVSERACGGGAWYFPDGWFLRDPAALCRALADGFEAGGGEIVSGAKGDVVSLVPGAGGTRVSVRTAGGAAHEADVCVIAAGAHSAALSRSLGERIPLDTERGYHVEWAQGSEATLTRPVCSVDGGFIATPMANGMRAAGLVEFGGTRAPPVRARFDQLEGATRELLVDDSARGLGTREAGRDWLGFRPTLPDALPVIGRARSCEAVIYAFGAQHIGWTCGGITAKLVTELALGKEPSVDLAPYSASRFRLW